MPIAYSPAPMKDRYGLRRGSVVVPVCLLYAIRAAYPHQLRAFRALLVEFSIRPVDDLAYRRG